MDINGTGSVSYTHLDVYKRQTVTNVDEWGKKRLAYEIQKMHEAYYYFIQFESDSVCPNEVEAHIRIMEPVIRYLCVRVDA